jgi:hypothetical protein
MFCIKERRKGTAHIAAKATDSERKNCASEQEKDKFKTPKYDEERGNGIITPRYAYKNRVEFEKA